MSYKKENLIKLLKLIEEISSQPGNEWFKEKILSILGQRSDSSLSPAIRSLHDDLKRTKYFLKNIDKTHHREGFNFYNKIKDFDLKSKLIIDYKEMKMALFLNDILEYARRKCIQLERGFDYVITKTNGWDVVSSNPNLYTEIIVPSGNFNQTFRIRDNFFKVDLNNRQQKVQKEISEIEFKTKAVYCFTYYQFDFTKYFSGFNDIYFLRNKASHASLSQKDKIRIDKINAKFSEQSIFYNKMFQSYLESLKDLY